MIETLLRENEGKTVEFKESASSLNGIIKTVIAFANTAGGTIAIGVKDGSKDVVGISNILQEEERLASALADSISPLLIPDIEIHTYQEKELLILRVPHGVGPYFLKSEGIERGVYVRFGSTNRVADAEMLSSLRLLAENIAYDELPHLRGHLDSQLMKNVFERIKKTPTQQVCENLGIMTNSSGKTIPTNGGILLFGTDRLKFFPDSIIRCARFLGATKEKILDHIDLNVSLPLSIDPTIAFIERNIHKEAKIGRIFREDILEYPPAAIRESVINAILHADYSMRGCNIQIAIFDNRIEITNPGGLPFGQTIEKAISGSSKLRNRVIGRVFRELQIIEQWGSGLQRILGACKKQGLKTPLIEELNNQFRLTLYSNQIEEIEIEPWGKLIMKFLKEEGEVSPKDAAKIWKVSTRTARDRLKSLQEDGFILRIGKSANDPNLKYILNRKFTL
jgi:predicted HTH transcriptional regulator